jgi:hypothetical protein
MNQSSNSFGEPVRVGDQKSNESTQYITTLVEKLKQRLPVFISMIYYWVVKMIFDIDLSNTAAMDMHLKDPHLNKLYVRFYIVLIVLSTIWDAWIIYIIIQQNKTKYKISSLYLFGILMIITNLVIFVLTTNVLGFNIGFIILFGWDQTTSYAMCGGLMAAIYILIVMEDYYWKNLVDEYESEDQQMENNSFKQSPSSYQSIDHHDP